jgi:two-component system response regulator CpxR
MPTVCVIDDDYELFSLLDEYLRAEGFHCVHIPDPAVGLDQVRSPDVDVVILDVMLPHMNGFEVLRHLRSREESLRIPVLMLTARHDEIDTVLGLEMGADDYIGKPFSPRELTARIRVLLRWAAGAREEKPADEEECDGLRINKSSLSVTVNGKHTDLTNPEMRCLLMLAEDAGTVVSRDTLYKEIFGHPAWTGDRSLDMLVSRLRKKIGARPDGGERIKAVRGEGYVFLSVEGDSAAGAEA